MKLTLPKVGTWSPPGLPKIQSSSSGVKTPFMEVFFIPLERSWSLDVRNGLAWVIWTSEAQVIDKRKAGSLIGSLTPDYYKSGIDPNPTSSGGVRHVVGKLSKRATRLLQTSSQSEVWARSYGCPKSRESRSGQFSGLLLGSLGKKCHSDVASAESCREYYKGEGGGFPRVQAVVSQMSPRLPVACPNIKRVQNEF